MFEDFQLMILLLKEIVERVLRIAFPDKKKRKAKNGI
jgi:hypothetical protein